MSTQIDIILDSQPKGWAVSCLHLILQHLTLYLAHTGAQYIVDEQ